MVRSSRQGRSHLVRENQSNVEEFKKFKVATHKSRVRYKEDSYDQMLFKDLVQEFPLQQKNNAKYESVESDTQVVILQVLPHGTPCFQHRHAKCWHRLRRVSACCNFPFRQNWFPVQNSKTFASWGTTQWCRHWHGSMASAIAIAEKRCAKLQNSTRCSRASKPRVMENTCNNIWFRNQFHPGSVRIRWRYLRFSNLWASCVDFSISENSRRLWLSDIPCWKGFLANLDATGKFFPALWKISAAPNAVPAKVWALTGKEMAARKSALWELSWTFSSETATAFLSFSGRPVRKL